ncbi:Serine/threonine-protein phosphatase Pgam5 [Diplonema papillatum]|nr:Serine/threonine-protein phosphatase Pgam5 [Diplonema papillatum]
MTNARMYTLVRGAAAAVGLFGGLCLRKGVADAKTVGGLGDGLGGSWGVALDLDWDKEFWKEENLLGTNSRASPGRATRDVILVRHGQYYMETGQLTPKGHVQAEAAAKRVREMFDPTDLLVSTSTRALETVRPFEEALQMKPTSDAELCESMMCPPNDRPLRVPEEVVIANFERTESAYRRLFRRPASKNRDEVVVVVCHANVIRYWLLRAMQMPPEFWAALSIPHASVTHIRINYSGRPNLRCVGDAGHHPPCNVTTRNVSPNNEAASA